MLDWAGESQYYVEPKRLASLGYLEATKAPGKTRERTVYTLTEKGLEALRDWARTPATFTPLKSEVLIRLLVADLVGDEATRTSIATLRDDVLDLLTRIEETEAGAAALPHRRRASRARHAVPSPPARAASGADRGRRARACAEAAASTGAMNKARPIPPCWPSPAPDRPGDGALRPGFYPRRRPDVRVLLAREGRQECGPGRR